MNVPHFERRVSSSWPIVVLVVDDSVSFANTLARLLRRREVSVVQAQDAHEALAYLSSGNIDLVLSDGDMPGIDGVTLLRIVGELWPHVWRVLCTAYVGTYGAMSQRYEGAVDCVFEKGQEGEILALIQSLVQQRLSERLEFEQALTPTA